MKYNLPVEYNKIPIHEKRLVREQYIKEQDGKCYHCDRKLDETPPFGVMKLTINESLFPDGFFKWPVHLHHSHDTGLTLGAVHAVCNAVLWQYYGE